MERNLIMSALNLLVESKILNFYEVAETLVNDESLYKLLNNKYIELLKINNKL